MGQGGSRTGKDVIPGNKDKEGRTRKKVSCGKHGACRQEILVGVFGFESGCKGDVCVR